METQGKTQKQARDCLDDENLAKYNEMVSRMPISVDQAKLWVWVGSGVNGKTTLINLLAEAHRMQNGFSVRLYEDKSKPNDYVPYKPVTELVVFHEWSELNADMIKEYLRNPMARVDVLLIVNKLPKDNVLLENATVVEFLKSFI